VHRKLIWTTMLLFAVFGVALIASGEGAEKGQAGSLSPEQKRAKRTEAAKNRPRFANVRYVTAKPLGDGGHAPPSATVIEYDNNVAVQRSPNTAGVVVGNQFDVNGLGLPIVNNWTITGFVLQNAGPAFLGSATVAFFGGPGGGTTAPFLAAFGVTGVNGGIQGFALGTPLLGTGSFLGGVVNSTYAGCAVTSVPPGTTCNGVALDNAQNSTNPLGFHAVSIAAVSPVAGGFGTLGSLNAIFKVTGTNLPVELTNFSVDSGADSE
jgi:hypothetical protein